MGPEGGDRGGTVIAEGTLEEITKVKESYTGLYVKHMLDRFKELPENKSSKGRKKNDI
jgi:excinuclease ABC subunit A